MEKLKLSFEKYLIDCGYSKTTPKNHPSTVYDYSNRISFICKAEKLTWEDLSIRIDELVREYDKSGIKANEGRKSHHAVINALKAYSNFIKTLN